MARKASVTKYTLRNIDDDLWQAVKARAAKEGRPIRFVLLSLLRVYANHGFFRVVETFDAKE
jgi:hypothetical protein